MIYKRKGTQNTQKTQTSAEYLSIKLSAQVCVVCEICVPFYQEQQINLISVCPAVLLASSFDWQGSGFQHGGSKNVLRECRC